MNAAGPSRIFISYSHRGKGPEWKAALLRALHIFEQHHLLDVWEDGKIRVSRFWDDDIRQALADAKLAVVLLTPEALDPRSKDDPNYILETEFPILRERQQASALTVFPLICEDCNWRAHDWLRATQAPNNSNPLSELAPAAQDRVLRGLATRIAEELSRIALAEISAPRASHPSAKTYLDKFSLTRVSGLREEKLIGREQELALLDLAFGQPHTSTVSLVAWGGVGKTMLVQHWLQRLQREGWFDMRRIYAWSFYSQGTKEDRQVSEDTFLAHALEWFGVQCAPTLSPWEKGRLLADAVARERSLLILDGIEPLQYPPGPMGGQLRAPGVQSLLKHLARKTSNIAPNSQRLTLNRALCVLTTREPLTDLADFQRREGSPWGSVLRVDLGNLTAEAGAALLHHAGANRAGAAEIKPVDKELLAASREVDGHALTLNLLGRFLARAHGGDIQRRDLVKFEEADRKVQGGTTFKMLAAFESWFAKGGSLGLRRLSVLRLLGLFDRPADFGCIAVLRRPPMIPGLTEAFFLLEAAPKPIIPQGWLRNAFAKIAGRQIVGETPAGESSASAVPLADEDWNETVSFLADFGLVLRIYSPNGVCALDCHPLVREYYSEQLLRSDPNAWRLAQLRLFEHLSANTVDRNQPTLEELQPLYQAVSHGCWAGVHEIARSKVYRDRIQRVPVFYSAKFLGAHASDLAALACFFSKPWSELTLELPEIPQAWIMSEAAQSMASLGRLDEAVPLLGTAVELAKKHGNTRGIAVRSSVLCELELLRGNIGTALAVGKESIVYVDQTDDQPMRIILRGWFADALHQCGDPNCLTVFEEAERLQAIFQPSCPFLYSGQGFRYCTLLLAQAERAAWRTFLSPYETEESRRLTECNEVKARIELTADWTGNSGLVLDLALDHLALGRVSLYTRILVATASQAEEVDGTTDAHFDNALEGFHNASERNHLPAALLSRAWWRSLSHDFSRARADLDEAWDIAERGPMRLHMADIHLYRARLFFREKPYPWKSPQADLTAAEKLITDCGYHRRDEELADAKRAILSFGA